MKAKAPLSKTTSHKAFFLATTKLSLCPHNRGKANVNYAVKSSYLLSFLESVPEILADGHEARLQDANWKEMKFEDVVKSAEQTAGLVLVY